MGSGLLQAEPGTALHTLFTLVFPSVGVLLSAAFSLSPLPRLISINKAGELQGYDPLPPTLNLGSGVAWVLYSVMASNPFTFASGAVAAASSVYAFLVSHADAAKPARAAVEHLTMALMGVFLSTSLAVMLLERRHPEAALATVGLVANAVVLAVYVAPLKNMANVIRTRDSSSIYAPWSALQGLNLVLWTVYGLCVMDVWILASSAFGLAAAAAALLLKVIYPNHPPSAAAAATTAAVSSLPLDSAASSLSSQSEQSLVLPPHAFNQTKPKSFMVVSPVPEGREGEEEDGRLSAPSAAVVVVHGA